VTFPCLVKEDLTSVQRGLVDALRFKFLVFLQVITHCCFYANQRYASSRLLKIKFVCENRFWRTHLVLTGSGRFEKQVVLTVTACFSKGSSTVRNKFYVYF